MITLVCSCGSFVELSSAFRSLSGDNLALASHPRMGKSHILDVFKLEIQAYKQACLKVLFERVAKKIEIRLLTHFRVEFPVFV